MKGRHINGFAIAIIVIGFLSGWILGLMDVINPAFTFVIWISSIFTAIGIGVVGAILSRLEDLVRYAELREERECLQVGKIETNNDSEIIKTNTYEDIIADSSN